MAGRGVGFYPPWEGQWNQGYVNYGPPCGYAPWYSRYGMEKWGYTNRAVAIARVKGGPLAPQIQGIVRFEDVSGGTRVCVQVTGLPPYQPAQHGEDPVGPHGFHIHENGTCEIGDPEDPFQAAGEHWNPDKQPHGNHAGDFPVLFSNNGYAWMCFFTNRFKVRDIIGKAIIIHKNPDDYRTQPAGDAGKRLACGVIEWAYGLPYN